jgi:tetratricopeptide (TPR) repeat protein
VKNIVVVFPEEWDTSGVAQVCVEEAEELAAAGGEEEAIDWWEEAISLLDDEDEQRAELLILVAVRHGARKEYEPARDALRKVLDAPPSVSIPRRLVAQEYMASLYWQQEMKRQALEAMEAALLIAFEEQKPEREKDIHEAIARLKRELGEQQ